MAIKDKSKEELIAELQQLRDENISLKASFAKEIAEYKLTHDHLLSKMMNCDAIFESSPVAMFIIDENTNIVMVNLAAVKLCGGNEEEILQHRPGNALRCVHSIKDPRGCGYSPDCKICEVRNGIEALIAKGGTISGAELEFTLTQNGLPQQVWMNVGVEPLMKDGQKLWCIAMNDISGHKKTEHLLKESQTLLNSIIDSTNDMIWSVDAEHFGLLQWNTSFHDYFLNDRRIEICIGMAPKDLFPLDSEYIPFWTELFSRTLKEGSCSTEYETFSQTRILQINLELLIQNGKTFGISVFAKNITAQKRAEVSLIESEIRFREVLENSQDASYKRNIQTNVYDYLSPVFNQITGYTQDEMNNLPLEDAANLIHPDDMLKINDVISLALSGSQENAFQVEYRYKHKNDSEYRWLLDKFTIMHDALGKPIAMIGSVSDISKRKQSEQELIDEKGKTEQSEYRLKLATASGQLGIWDWNLVDNSMIWDERMFELYGITPDTFPSNIDAWINGLHPEDKQMALDECNSALNGERDFNTLFRVLHPDGTVLYLKANGSVLRDDNGRPVRMIGINRDITETQLASKQLLIEKEKAEESEMVFRKLFEDSSDAQLLFKDGKFVNCNKATLKLLGTSEKTDIVGLSPIDVAPEIQPDGRLSLDAAIEYTNMAFDNGFCQFEWLCKRFGGELILLDIILMPIVLKGEEHLHGTWRDITARKKAEQALMESEERYRNLFQKSYASMLLINPETGEIIDANPAACSYYGWNHEEMLKMKLHEINTMNEVEIMDELLSAQTEKRNYFIFKHRLANSSIRDVEVYSSPFIISGKTVLYSIIHDITNRKLAEEALLESEKRIQKKLVNLLSPESDISELSLEDIIDTDAIQSMMEEFFKFTKIPVAIIDLEGKVLVGPGWQDICTKFHRIHHETLANCIECDTILTNGIPQGTFKSYLCKNSLWDNATPMIVGGRHVGNLFTGQFFYEGEKPDDELFRSQAARYGFDEKEYMDAVNRVPIYTRETIHHALTFFVTLSNMISSLSHANIGLAKVLEQHKQTEIELITAKEKAEESDRLKSAFLANMSHEIRTPLNSIIGFSELLNDPYFDQEQKTVFTRTIIENGNNLLVIISDIIDLSMLDARQIKIKNEQFPAKGLIRDLVNEFRSKASSKGFEFNSYLPEDVENVIINNDIYRIRQIFNNLIGNALKFTTNGFIEIGYYSDKSNITFYVKDSGIGIAPEFHKDIFKRFRQVDETKTRKYGGNGLGLSISKNLVKILGGKIWVDSEEGKGSTFYFSLPIN